MDGPSSSNCAVPAMCGHTSLRIFSVNAGQPFANDQISTGVFAGLQLGNALVGPAKRIYLIGPSNCILRQAECADCVLEFIWRCARLVQNALPDCRQARLKR
jgi:hypothetical protein